MSGDKSCDKASAWVNPASKHSDYLVQKILLDIIWSELRTLARLPKSTHLFAVQINKNKYGVSYI